MLFANILFAYTLVGLFYYGRDATDDSEMYSSSEAAEEYSIYDFGLNVAGVAVALPIAVLTHWLILIRNEKSKMIAGLLLSVLQIVMAAVLIPIITTTFCCEAAALWTYGLLGVCALEILGAQTIVSTLAVVCFS